MSDDANRTTEYQYTLDGQLAVLIVRNDVTGDQVTRWIYGTTLEESGVAANSLVRAKIYPDSDDNAPAFNGPDSRYDRVEYRYNRWGELTELKDQNETVHAYDYDQRGRLTHDRVTTLGAGIDGAVRRISRSYDRAGQLESVTSWSEPALGAGSAVNQVLRRYNGFGQLTAEYQSHDGPVATGSTPVVRYTYADGSNRHIRRLSTLYPNGRELALDYGTTGSDDDKLGRIQVIRDGGAGGTPLARYTRRGLSATMRVEYPQCGTEDPVQMSYIKLPSEPDGPAGDQYTGQDQFNRIVDVRWRRGETATDIDRFQYGFNRANNRTYRRNVPGSAMRYDEKYSYDSLYQLTELKRGTLTEDGTVISGQSWEEKFTFDPTGNWDRYRAGVTSGSSVDQTRTHNRVNEITATADPSVPLGYDRAGNMTRQGESGSDPQLSWDAWNRLVEVKWVRGSIAGRYQYDGLTRRVWKQSRESEPQLVHRHYYYSDQWQVLEERVGAVSVAERQFVWGMRYADDLILRDSPDPLPQYNRIYATHDQWHCTGLVSETGEVVQRFAYDAFGNPLDLSAGFIPGGYFYYWEYRYGAYRWDTETETYQVRYRQYQPRLGRWLSRDLLEFEAEDCNLFRYVGNKPPNSADPQGLAGLNLQGDKDDVPTYVDNTNPILPKELRDKMQPNCWYYTVMGHGDQMTVTHHPGGRGTGVGLAIDGLDQLIQDQKNYVKGTPFLLLTCCPCAGFGANDIASQLAERYKVDVAGASCTTETRYLPKADGGIEVKGIDLSPSPTDPKTKPEWRVKHPPAPLPPRPRGPGPTPPRGSGPTPPRGPGPTPPRRP